MLLAIARVKQVVVVCGVDVDFDYSDRIFAQVLPLFITYVQYNN